VRYLSKSQKEKSVTKDKLLSMKVIDADGNLVGTVKDVAFTIGKTGISLNVETKSEETQEVPWEDIQAVGDFVLLRPVKPVHAQQEPTPQQVCPTCKGPLSYVKEYQRWYCYKCQKYA
jgi:sporulation protein YlmC with PRC-barrel domain